MPEPSGLLQILLAEIYFFKKMFIPAKNYSALKNSKENQVSLYDSLQCNLHLSYLARVTRNFSKKK